MESLIFHNRSLNVNKLSQLLDNHLICFQLLKKLGFCLVDNKLQFSINIVTSVDDVSTIIKNVLVYEYMKQIGSKLKQSVINALYSLVNYNRNYKLSTLNCDLSMDNVLRKTNNELPSLISVHRIRMANIKTKFANIKWYYSNNENYYHLDPAVRNKTQMVKFFRILEKNYIVHYAVMTIATIIV